MAGQAVALPHHFSAARETIRRMSDDPEAACPRVVLGGVAINQFEPLARLLGAAAGPSNSKETVQIAHLLLEST